MSSRKNPDVAQAVYLALHRSDKDLAEEFIRQVPPELTNNMSLFNQLKMVNSYFRAELGMLNVSTIEERECLVEERDFEGWMRNFEEVVIPTLVKHRGS